MELIALLIWLISIVLFISWIVEPTMSERKKFFVNQMIRRRVGRIVGDIEGFVLGITGSTGKRFLAFIMVVVLFPIWVALWWILGIPGVIYVTYKNLKLKAVMSLGLTPFWLVVYFAAPFFVFL